MQFKTQRLLEQAKASEDQNSSISGAKRDFESARAAADFFSYLKGKLLDLEAWNAQSGLSSYTHFDKNGNEVKNEPLREEDFIRILVKGTGKYDWVRVRQIYRAANEIVLTVKPAFDPTDEDKTSTSHFFSSEATNNFCLLKNETTIEFYVVGLNEKTNVGEADGVIETARNAAVANLGFYLGIQKSEWTTFCQKFLELETEE